MVQLFAADGVRPDGDNASELHDPLREGLSEQVPAGEPPAEAKPAARHALTADQQRLAARHLGLVRVHLRTRLHMRRRTRHARRDFDELYQAGCLALVQAAARYDAERDGPFPAYVLPRIRRAVHAAVLAGRSLLRVPYGAACKRHHPAIRSGAPGRRFWHSQEYWNAASNIASPSSAESNSPSLTDQETIRHALRRRFEHAVRQAAEHMARTARRNDAQTLFQRITHERVLVSAARERTPVRDLASELGLSSGQVSDYEQRLLRVTRERLRVDAPALLLVRFANADADGFDGLVDERRRRRLLHAELRQFERRFAAFSLAERARTLYALVERSAAGVSEVARNLFLLTLPNP